MPVLSSNGASLTYNCLSAFLYPSWSRYDGYPQQRWAAVVTEDGTPKIDSESMNVFVYLQNNHSY